MVVNLRVNLWLCMGFIVCCLSAFPVGAEGNHTLSPANEGSKARRKMPFKLVVDENAYQNDTGILLQDAQLARLLKNDKRVAELIKKAAYRDDSLWVRKECLGLLLQISKVKVPQEILPFLRKPSLDEGELKRRVVLWDRYGDWERAKEDVKVSSLSAEEKKAYLDRISNWKSSAMQGAEGANRSSDIALRQKNDWSELSASKDHLPKAKKQKKLDWFFLASYHTSVDDNPMMLAEGTPIDNGTPEIDLGVQQWLGVAGGLLGAPSRDLSWAVMGLLQYGFYVNEMDVLKKYNVLNGMLLGQVTRRWGEHELKSTLIGMAVGVGHLEHFLQGAMVDLDYTWNMKHLYWGLGGNAGYLDFIHEKLRE